MLGEFEQAANYITGKGQRINQKTWKWITLKLSCKQWQCHISWHWTGEKLEQNNHL